MSLRQPVPRIQCLYQAARERVAGLQPRLTPYRNAGSTPSRTFLLPLGSRRLLHSSSTAPTKSNRLATARAFSSTPSHRHAAPKTIQQARSRYIVGPVSFLSIGLFVGAGVGLYLYFQYEKARVERQRIAEATKGVGKPKVGGPFELVDQNGQVWGSGKMKGKFSLVYFGFSHCPDICPEELDKMAHMLSLVSESHPPSNPKSPDLLPVFITCDPARDTPAVLKSYLREFHPGLIGLTGTWEQIKAVCKLYRVYFSTPQGVKPGMDYLVDHSIYFYLMDPEGDFVEAIGRQHTAEQGAKIISDHMGDWKGRIVKGQDAEEPYNNNVRSGTKRLEPSRTGAA